MPYFENQQFISCLRNSCAGTRKHRRRPLQKSDCYKLPPGTERRYAPLRMVAERLVFSCNLPPAGERNVCTEQFIRDLIKCIFVCYNMQ